jgi:hypothetical protein
MPDPIEMTLKEYTDILREIRLAFRVEQALQGHTVITQQFNDGNAVSFVYPTMLEAQ